MSETNPLRLWRIAGGLAIAHVVLMLGSFTLQKVAPLGASQAVVIADHVQWSMAKGFTGGFLTLLSFLVFLVDATLIARLVRGRTETSRWWAATAAAAAISYVATTFIGLAALGGALYDGHHGAPVTTVTALVDMHWFAIYLATAALGLFTLALAGAGHAAAALPRWTSYTGYLVGAICILSVPAARSGLSDMATLVWLVWFVAFAIVALRRPRQAVIDRPAASVLVG